MTNEQITIFATTGALIVGQIMQRLDARRVARELKTATAKAAEDLKDALQKQNQEAERNAAQIKTDLETAQADYLLKLEIIRIEGNSKMAAQKKALWTALLRLSKSTNDPSHEAEARSAEQDYNDHCEAEALAEQRIRTFVEGQKMQQLETARKKAEGALVGAPR